MLRNKIHTNSWLLLLCAALLTSALANAESRQRVIVLGFDGADAQVIEKMLAEGKLPNLAKLKKMGTYSRLATTNPAQSPVAWASLTTGTNPGKTNIFGFLRRGEGSYAPKLAMVERSMVPTWSGDFTWLYISCAAGLATALLTACGLALRSFD